MQDLLINYQPGMQILALIGFGAVLVAEGCVLWELLLDLLDRFCRLGLAHKVVVLFFVVQLTMFGGAKHGTNDVDDVTCTNDVELVEGGTNEVGGIVLNAPQPLFNGVAFLGGCGPLGTTAPTVVDPDVVRGYRLASVSTNGEISYAMPSEGVVRGTWHLTGAYEDVQRVGLESLGGLEGAFFKFPIGNQLCTSLWAYTWGKVRPQLKNASNEIAAVGASMSAIPGVSRFWTSVTAYDSYLFTWENFAVGKVGKAEVDTLLAAGSPLPHPANAQIEFFRNGDFIIRSNNVESVYRRVIEPNPIGPGNPEGPDTPGMPVCPYGPVQDPSVIGETNAYCWVDIVVNNADAWVFFEGDGPSDLADPSFAAKAGETNHVVILIGKTYKVTCDMPFTVVDKSSPAIDERWEDDRTVWLNWPVRIWSVGDDEGPPLLLMRLGSGSHRGKGFTMFVSPSGLGGGFNWTNSCCSVSGSGYYFSYNCNGSCGCGGCSATGYYGYKGYRLPSWGGSCGCSYEEEPHDPHDDDDPDEPPPPAGVSIYFSETAVIFEDEYHPTSNLTVEARSTTTRLCCSVYGGEHGGSVLITATGIDNRLDCVGGFQAFPVYRQLEPQETFAFTNFYKAVAQSGSANDIVVTGTFIENDTDESFDDEDKATAIKVEIKPVLNAPENDSAYRHKFGVGELVQCKYSPATAGVSWHSKGQGAFSVAGSDARYRCPLSAESNGIEIRGGGAEYTPVTSVVEPVSVMAQDIGYRVEGVQSGQAGGVLLTMTLHAMPMDVSFLGVKMEEVPDAEASKDGYFEDSYFMREWYHGRDQYAGIWRTVTEDNQFLADDAGFNTSLPQLDERGFVSPTGTNGWVSGYLTWDVPCGWAAPSVEEHDEPIGTFATRQQQVMTIDSSGNCEIRKHSQSVRRLASGQIYLNGELK